MKSYAICEVKSLDGDDPNGSFEAILSAPTLDRDGEVIAAKAFEPLPDRIPIDIDHGMTVATTVGSGQPYYDGDVLKIKGTFSSIPRAQELRTLVTEGHIGRMSVTFMGAERSTKDGVPHVERGELLNAAFVPIPSNREAAVLVAKAFAPDTKALSDSDVKFLKAMIRHHEAALMMARDYLAGDPGDERVTQLAGDIIKAQTAEIANMRGWLGADAPAAGSSDMPGMRSAPHAPEPATASAETDPEKAAAPAAAKSPADVSAYLAAARAQAEAATVL